MEEGEAATLSNMLGRADPFSTLLWGSLLGATGAIVLAVGQRILKLSEAITAWLGGIRAMMLAMVILVLAWSLGEVTNALETAPFLSSALSERMPIGLLPVAVFIVAALISFTTGTSWGTMAILPRVDGLERVAFVQQLSIFDSIKEPGDCVRRSPVAVLW